MSPLKRPWVGIKKSSPIDIMIERLFFSKSIPDVPLAERLRHFLEPGWKEQNFGRSINMDTKFIWFKAFSVKNSFPTNSISRRGRIVATGSKKNFEEGSHQKSSAIKKSLQATSSL